MDADPTAPKAADLTFVVELLAILPAPKPPADAKAPPRDSVVERDGLASKILTKGTGRAHPSARASVTVRYAAWTQDGELVGSSYTRDEPAVVNVGGDIPGWAEALQLMVEGERRRVWIPEPLAYGGAPGAPKGTLVFDIELQKIGPDAPL